MHGSAKLLSCGCVADTYITLLVGNIYSV